VKSIRKNIRMLYEPEEDAPVEKQYSGAVSKNSI